MRNFFTKHRSFRLAISDSRGDGRAPTTTITPAFFTATTSLQHGPAWPGEHRSRSVVWVFKQP